MVPVRPHMAEIGSQEGDENPAERWYQAFQECRSDFLSCIKVFRLQPVEALALLTRCRDIFRSVDSGGYVAYTDLMIGILCNELGEHELQRRADGRL